MTSHLPIVAAPLAVARPPTQAPRVGRIVALCTSPGGIPKRPREQVIVDAIGLAGDGHAHAKHNRPERAISLFDLEVLRQLVREGFHLEPGTAGENLTVEGLGVQSLPAGSILEVGDVVLRLEAPRKPCYVLDAIDPRLKDCIVGRCGYMASVVQGGTMRVDMPVRCVSSGPPTA